MNIFEEGARRDANRPPTYQEISQTNLRIAMGQIAALNAQLPDLHHWLTANGVRPDTALVNPVYKNNREWVGGLLRGGMVHYQTRVGSDPREQGWEIFRMSHHSAGAGPSGRSEGQAGTSSHYGLVLTESGKVAETTGITDFIGYYAVESDLPPSYLYPEVEDNAKRAIQRHVPPTDSSIDPSSYALAFARLYGDRLADFVADKLPGSHEQL
jgi:hypothetical protein